MNVFERQAHEDRVAQRISELARAHAGDRALVALSYFNKSPTLQKQPAANIDRLLTRIYDRAVVRFYDQRERGLHNDLESLGPGLTALVTAEAVKKFEEINDRPHPGKNFSPLEISLLIEMGTPQEDIEILKEVFPRGTDSQLEKMIEDDKLLPPQFFPESDNLYRMSLPAGAYSHVSRGSSFESVLFYTQATFSNGQMVNSSMAFPLPVETVVRIEGHSEGELWQNPNLTSDGQSRIE